MALPKAPRCGTQPHSFAEAQSTRADFTMRGAADTRPALEHLTLTHVWGPEPGSPKQGKASGEGWVPHISAVFPTPVGKLF